MAFKHKGATITARELSIGESEDAIRLGAKLPEDARTYSSDPFCSFMVAADVEGELDLPRVTRSSSEDEVAAAFVAWHKLPLRFMRAWQKEFDSANSAEGE